MQYTIKVIYKGKTVHLLDGTVYRTLKNNYMGNTSISWKWQDSNIFTKLELEPTNQPNNNNICTQKKKNNERKYIKIFKNDCVWMLGLSTFCFLLFMYVLIFKISKHYIYNQKKYEF